MANLGTGYDYDNAPENNFEPLPVGDYTAAITSDEVKTSQRTGAKYLNLVFEIIDGKGKGRKIYHLLNLWNPNETAKKIAVGELGSIQKAVGKKVITDSDELHNIPLIITLGIEPESANYGPENKITRFKPWKSASEPQEKKATPSQDWSRADGIMEPPLM